MKSTLTIILLALFAISVPAQELDSLRAIMDNRQAPQNHGSSPANSDTTTVQLGQKKVLEVIEHPDSTRIRVGNKEISIVENGSDSKIHIGNVEHRHHNHDNFRGHWAGVEWGMNNFVDKDLTLSREGEAAFMDLNSDRSWCFNLNFAQYSLGLGTSYLGLLTGLGLEFNNYFFDNANSLAEVDDHVVPVTLDEPSLSKSKLTTSWFRIPLILEVQFPKASRARRVFLSGGIITGLKLGSHTKVVYKGDSGKNRDRNKDDFNINPFRYGMTARVGFGCLNIFGDYYFTPLFVHDKGPYLHPFSLGMSFTF